MMQPNIIIPTITVSFTDFDIYVIVGVCLGFEFLIKPLIKNCKWATSDTIQSLVMIICIILVSINSTDTIITRILKGIIDGAVCNALYDLILSKFTKKDNKNEKL